MLQIRSGHSDACLQPIIFGLMIFLNKTRSLMIDFWSCTNKKKYQYSYHNNNPLEKGSFSFVEIAVICSTFVSTMGDH